MTEDRKRSRSTTSSMTGGTVVGPDGEHELDVAVDGETISGLHGRGAAGARRSA